ncbi:histone lysine demethylase PHF8-like isoform X2 [Lytechinus variegatus]|uniref:histone lysine demethylase PHF8-like isoform X2 n=1 Tax=Lytechinus variegatus TaxID=7654 RepID=UPI001BB19B05|nr:histone lysine demethylase PHF8-like isoform X2 [Lytechinus variegatus]
MASIPVYCICKQVYDVTRFMIECDVCKDWFHGSCVEIREDQSDDVEEFHCPTCAIVHGPTKLKKKKNWHRQDYTEEYDPTKPVQIGTAVFLRQLKSRAFRRADEILLHPRGHELTVDFLDKNGFQFPIMIDNKEGLGLIVPPPTFTVSDVQEYVGSDMEIDVIDVRKQDEMKMSMRDWSDYFTSPSRDKILNVISLEFSQTRLSDLVEAPRVVRKISWVENIWPDKLPEDCPYDKPRVSKYCLMSIKDSYTDFHVDFGGTSVWYHVLRGEKIFYFVKPTEENLEAYEAWSRLEQEKQSETFFGDKVDICYKCVVKQGQTLCIPTGWIHAVLTTVDSLVFGGNFLHGYSIGLQIKIHELEKRVKTPPKFQFPWFEATMWYAAAHLLDKLKEGREEKRRISPHIILGIKDLCSTLKSWTNKREIRHHQKEIPETVNQSQLIKELAKELKSYEPQTKKDKKKSKKKGQLDSKQIEALELLHSETEENLHGTTSHRLPALISKPLPGSYRAQAQDSKPSLKLRIPKVEAADQTSTTATSESEDERYRKKRKKNTTDARNPQTLKLVVSNGKIVSRGGSPVTVQNTGFLPISKSEGSSEEINIDDISAEDIKERRKLMSSQGSLKLRLSFNGKSNHQGGTSSSHDTSSLHNTSDTLDSDDDVLPSDRSPRAPQLSNVDVLLQATKLEPLPTISLADIEAELKNQPASPGTQDAIQGMLSISLPGRSSTSPTLAHDDDDDDDDDDEDSNEEGYSRERRASRHRHRKRYSDDPEELPNCFQDAKYVYPSLDDDGDGPLFKSRSKTPRRDQLDLPWNPKAKVSTPSQKLVRPVRENARRPNIETGLADAAARLANKPRPKRQYIRRKPLAPKRAAEPLEDIPSTSSAFLAQSHNDPFTFHDALDVEELDLTQSAPANLLKPNTALGPGRPPNKKPRKGMATAKQRLGKILKLKKGGRIIM